MKAMSCAARPVDALLANAGLGTLLSEERLLGGRNNVATKVTATLGVALHKQYFHSAQDPRDRLATEIAFLSHLQACGCRLQPAPLACDPTHHAALLEYIEGPLAAAGTIGNDEIDQAADFILACNQANNLPSARNLPLASEACFSLAEHLATTGRRVRRLLTADPDQTLGDEFIRLVQDELIPTWEDLRQKLGNSHEREIALPLGECILSPSDFGFHNSLRTPQGHLRFIDFEYAGWDDPAKLLCDLANQPDLLLPTELAHRFQRRVIAGLKCEQEALALRAESLEPLYQLKWACICLNVFLNSGPQVFSAQASPEVLSQRRITQLAKAAVMVGRARHSLSRL